jgi:hypothetical protein
LDRSFQTGSTRLADRIYPRRICRTRNVCSSPDQTAIHRAFERPETVPTDNVNALKSIAKRKLKINIRNYESLINSKFYYY